MIKKAAADTVKRVSLELGGKGANVIIADADDGAVERDLRSGMVDVNGNFLGGVTPFVGYKESGNGRKGPVCGLEEYLEVKAVAGIS